MFQENTIKSSSRLLLCITLFFTLVGTGKVLESTAQVDSDTIGFVDDPIIAAIDSLYKLDLFDSGYGKVEYPINAKYDFASDSVPHYDNMIYEARLSKLNAASPFDLQYNKVVQGFINLYAMRRRELVSRMMALSQYYFPLFEESLDKYNLPLEFKYLAICESALNPLARSRSGAMGLWQFMYPTGKMFGLKVTSYVDERCDPYKSTIAACQYFEYLYKMFGDWEIVLAAYNGGPGTVSRAIRRSGGKKNYWEIRPYLPRETRGYIPAFIAVNYIMNHTAEHNIQSAVPKKFFLEVDTVYIKKQLSFFQISSVLDIPEDEIRYLNPCYRKKVIPVTSGQKHTLTLPLDKIGVFVCNEDSIYNFISKSALLAAQSAPIKQKAIESYTVRRGDNLNVIARRNGCTVANLKKWNGIKSNTIHPGKRLVIYHHVAASSRASTTAKQTSSSGGYNYHLIKRGDSLYKLALMYKTTISELRRMNNFGVNYNLLPGNKVKVGVL